MGFLHDLTKATPPNHEPGFVVSRPKISSCNRKVTCHFQTIRDASIFFNDNVFEVEFYEDVSDVPESILVIPALSTLVPIAWRLGEDILVYEVDEAFTLSLDLLKKSFNNLYCGHRFESNLRCKLVNNRRDTSASKLNGLLFSGGVDSTFSFLNLSKDQPPHLFSIWGSDIACDLFEAWNVAYRGICEFADRHGTSASVIKSNFRAVLNYHELQQKLRGGDLNCWWGNVQHGLGLLGLCAPLAYKRGIESIYFASSDEHHFDIPWGSHPDIDNNVFFSGSRANSHGLTFRRQEKIRYVVEHCMATKQPMKIRSCWHSKHGDNCGLCMECFRTFMAFLAEGVNPSDYGFPMGVAELNEILYRFENKHYFYIHHYSEADLNHLDDIKTRLRSFSFPIYDSYRWIIDWVISTDFRQLEGNRHATDVIGG